MTDELLGIACSKIRELTVPAYVKDSEQRYVMVNDAYAEFFGMAADACVGLKARDIVGLGEDDALDDRERRALVFGEEQQASCVDPSGRYCYRVNIERFDTEDGAIFVFGIFDAVPVERRVPAGEALEEDLFRSMMEQSPSALFLRDSRHRLLMANSAYLSLIGRRRAEAIGRTEIETLGESWGRDHYEANERLLETGENSETEGEIVHADGRPIPVLIRRRRVAGIDGNF
jgi:PAS domain S-box-containing protein